MKLWLAVLGAAFLLTAGFGQGSFGNAPDFSGTITPAQITATQNNYSPGGLCNASTVRLSSDASRNITGMQPCQHGWVILLRNVGAQDIVLTDASGSSTANYRFDFGGSDATVATKTGLFLEYDAISARWVKYSSGGSSIATPVSVANGGTGLASGTSGGILGYTASGTLASSVALTANTLIKGGGAGATPTNSLLSDDGTTATYTGTGGGSFTKVTTTASNGGLDGTEGTGASLTAAASHDLLYPDSTAHRWKMNNNNAGAVQVVASGVDINTSDQVTVTHLAAALPVAQGGTGLTAGTSGGIPAYTASGTIASSAALTANLPVIGGGAGVVPTVGTRSGNTTAYVTTTGTQTSGDCVKIDASGNHIANGSTCTGMVIALMNPGSFASPADSTTYYAGQGGTASTTYNNVRYYVQKACTVKAVTYTTVAGGTVQSNESYNQDIFQNGTTQVTGSSAAFAAATATVQNQVTGLSYALAAGDYIALRIVTPAWGTNPTSMFWRADVYCE